jgi:hypothetical protein
MYSAVCVCLKITCLYYYLHMFILGPHIINYCLYADSSLDDEVTL